MLPGAPTADDPWQIVLEPRTFDLGNSGVTLPDHTSLRGAGVGQTMIEGTATITVTMGSSTRSGPVGGASLVPSRSP